ncbi:MAG TPA: glycosyltransferase family 39 protein [Gaiellaceae bacterium]
MSRAETALAPRASSAPAVAIVRRHWGVILSGVVWVLLVVNFSRLAVISGDESVQYRFVQRLFGDVPDAVGYYFGLGLVEAPFYAVGSALDAAGLHTVDGQPVHGAAIALGLGLLMLAAWPLLAAVIGGLGLRYAGFSILAAAVGMPFLFYASFVPGKNHALDALLFTAAIYLSYRYFRQPRPEPWVPYALGAVFGLAYTVRYFDGAAAVALVLVLLWFRRWADAALIAVTSAVVCLLLFAIPWAYGVPVFSGGYKAENLIVFAPLNPLRMLFTNHRGLFVWSPVSVLAAIGLVLLFVRRPEWRRFLTAVTAMAVAIVASYSLIGFWDGTWSFSQRFYTPLFPLVAIGLAGLLDAAPRFGLVAASLAALWTAFLMFNLEVIGGPQYTNTISGGATDLARLPATTHTSPGAYLWGLKHKSNLLR